jgi:hypothetical protein
MSLRFILAVIIGIILVTTLGTTMIQRTYAAIQNGAQLAFTEKRAPLAVTAENVYVAWQSNNTSNKNEEIMFRASSDGGATFGDKINLSNTTNSDSWKVEIAGEGDNVVVSWWETNQTSDIPVARISTDAGQTFGPMLMLATNGTLGSEAG